MATAVRPSKLRRAWLVLTHDGVGPMRKYCIGAMLLDLDDPTKVIGQLDQPLLKPKDEKRGLRSECCVLGAVRWPTTGAFVC